VGGVSAGAGRKPRDPARRGAHRRGRPLTRGRLHAGTRVASCELLQPGSRRRVVGDTAGIRVTPAAICCRRRRRQTSISKRGATAWRVSTPGAPGRFSSPISDRRRTGRRILRSSRAGSKRTRSSRAPAGERGHGRAARSVVHRRDAPRAAAPHERRRCRHLRGDGPARSELARNRQVLEKKGR